jgi:hypothetical protein
MIPGTWSFLRLEALWVPQVVKELKRSGYNPRMAVLVGARAEALNGLLLVISLHAASLSESMSASCELLCGCLDQKLAPVLPCRAPATTTA